MSNYPLGSDNSAAPWNDDDNENQCAYCDKPTTRYYCSQQCKRADNE